MFCLRAARLQLPKSVVTVPQPKHEWNIVAPNEKASPEKVVHIPVLDVQGSQGDGREAPDHEMVASQISVRESWLCRNLALSAPGNLSIIAGVGDSMKPTFSDGDLLLVDRGVSEIRVDAVYVLELHNNLYIKRLQIRPDGAILMLSDNNAYEPIPDSGSGHGVRACPSPGSHGMERQQAMNCAHGDPRCASVAARQ